MKKTNRYLLLIVITILTFLLVGGCKKTNAADAETKNISETESSSFEDLSLHKEMESKELATEEILEEVTENTVKEGQEVESDISSNTSKSQQVISNQEPTTSKTNNSGGSGNTSSNSSNTNSSVNTSSQGSEDSNQGTIAVNTENLYMKNYILEYYGSVENFKTEFYKAYNQIRAEYGFSAPKVSAILEDRTSKVAEICSSQKMAYHPTYPGVEAMKGYGVCLESTITLCPKELFERYPTMYDLVKHMTVGHTARLATKDEILYSGVSLDFYTSGNMLYVTIVLDGADKVTMNALTKEGVQEKENLVGGKVVLSSFISKYAGMTP